MIAVTQHIRTFFFGLLLLLTVLPFQIQAQEISYRVEGAYVIIQFPQFEDTHLTDELLEAIGSSCVITDSLESLKRERNTSKGWEFVKQTEKFIEYRKSISELDNEIEFVEQQINIDKEGVDPLNVAFGSNRFNAPSVIQAGDNQYTFLVKAKNASSVYLAGTFNNWSTIKTPMQENNGFWTVTIPLEAGKHLYKFVVDGQWALDPANQLSEMDDSGNINSVYFVYNYTFRLPGFQKAKKVFLAGDFNAWAPDELAMLATTEGWEYPMYLKEGKHRYKFIIDNRWITDPNNPDIEDDGDGNLNSVLYNGLDFYFRLPAFQQADRVKITGNFGSNAPADFDLEKRSNGWQSPLQVQGGNYEYQCIVDGATQPDPTNPYEIG
ncbi:MAG: hypothetical protein AAF598_20245, partial [Bacteroidota bacterium]